MSNKDFKPGSELTFQSVVMVREQLVKALKKELNPFFTIDLTNVVHCDSAGLALLIEAKKLCLQNKKQLKLVGVPEKTRSLAEFCGVGGMIETIQPL